MVEVFIPWAIAPECHYILDFLAGDIGLREIQIVEWSEGLISFRTPQGEGLDFPPPFIRPQGDYDLSMLPAPGREFAHFADRIPLLYGEDRLEENGGIWRCGLDIFGSIFFLLSRWEEPLQPKDQYGRCDEACIWSVRAGLHTRALVNEYAWVLAELLGRIGVTLESPHRSPRLKMTHDVDGLFRYGSMRSLCKALAGDVLHRHSLVEPFRTVRDFVRVWRGTMRDPLDTFDLFMDLSESFGVQSEFYFIPSFASEYDARYDIRDVRIRRMVDHVVERGHVVGIHPSRNTFGNADQFAVEVRRLRELTTIESGRHHYLQVRTPDSYRVWEEQALAENSSVGFSLRSGLRSGCCTPYWLYDVAERRQLCVREYPLALMDGALCASENSYAEAQAVQREVERYGGVFTLLWHTDAYNRWPYNAYNDKLMAVCAKAGNRQQ